MRFSMPELLVVLAIVMVIFGPKQLPRLGKMLGSSIKSFKKGMEDETPEVPAEDDESVQEP